jgi:hypothetical protein
LPLFWLEKREKILKYPKVIRHIDETPFANNNHNKNKKKKEEELILL